MHNPELIRVEMARKNITGEQLAGLAGLSRPTVTKIVHGKEVLPKKLKAAADVLGLTMEDLFKLKVEEKQSDPAQL